MSTDAQKQTAVGTPPQGKDVPAQPDVSKDVSKMRREKIHAYLVESLEKPDALQANLGATSSDLMSLGLHMKEAIDGAMADGAMTDVPGGPGRFEKLMPAVDGYLKVIRQIDRLAQLERRMTEAHTGGDRPKPR